MKLQFCIWLLLALAPLSAGWDNCWGDHRCAECVGGDRNTCTRCNHPYHMHYDEYGNSYCRDCGELTKEEQDDYFAKIWIGSIIGAVICAICIVLASIPVCCGKGANGPLIPLAVVSMVVAGICMAIPVITGKVVTDGVISDKCDQCGCTEDDEQRVKDALTGLGVIVSYTLGGGFIVVLLGGIVMCLGCCLCCPCCGPLQQAKKAQQDAAAGMPAVAVQGQVVGQPQPVPKAS